INSRNGVSTNVASASPKNQPLQLTQKSFPRTVRLAAPPKAERTGTPITATRKYPLKWERLSNHARWREDVRSSHAESKAFAESFAKQATTNQKGGSEGTNRKRRIGRGTRI